MPFDLVQMRGKWTYLTVDSGACDERCQNKLWKMRQLRRTQGKYMERIERVWLLSDAQTPDSALLKEHQGTWIVRAAGSALLRRLPPAADPQDAIYLMDPLGNLMMHYGPQSGSNDLRKDLARLLRLSRVG